MRRDAVIQALRRFEPEIRSRGATALYLFGSTARDEATEESDIDVFIDYQSGTRFTALDMIGIGLFLEDQLGREVDIITRKGLHPAIADGIVQSAIRIF